jgi:uncharacterized membrane protein YdbT with pleckstrin-like domain
MNPQDQPQQYNQQYDPKQRVSNELSVMQPGEQLICEIKRHPIGVLAIYFVIGIVLTTIAVLAFGVFPNILSSSGSVSSSQVTTVGAVIFLVVAFICAVFGAISTRVYWGNKWVVTSDSVTQISQTSLFNRQSAQLSLASIEDVTAEQNGILAQMFKFGVLKVETAGHREKFAFLFCPNPNFYAKCILEAREAYEMHLHGQQQQPYPPQGQDPNSSFKSNY